MIILKSISYVPHAIQRIVDHNLDKSRIEQIIKNTEAYDDLSRLEKIE